MSVCKVVLLGSMACAAEEIIKEYLEVNCEITAIKDAALERSSPVGEYLKECDIIVGGPITKEIALVAKNISLFHVFRGGIAGLGIEYLSPQVIVCNTYHHGPGIAEFCIMSMLMLPRKTTYFDNQLRKGDWSESRKMWGEYPDHDTLQNKRVLIIGAGHIGQHVGARLEPFGPVRAGITRDEKKERTGFDEIHSYNVLPEELPKADFIIVCCRLAAETTNLIDRKSFHLMKKSAFIINVAQGAVINEKAFYEALSEKRITGAAIDSWYQLPGLKTDRIYPSKYPFHTLENVILSPNRCSWTENMLRSRAKDVAANINNFVRKYPLRNQVGRIC